MTPYCRWAPTWTWLSSPNKTPPPSKPGKLNFRDTLIEITYLSWNQLRSVEEMLSSYHLAGSFRVDTVIADPTGDLRRLQSQVSRRFAERFWVRRRCEDAQQKVERNLRSIAPTTPWPDQVTAWLFPTGVTTHVLLVAALRNPTVRLRYLAAREVLQEYGYEDLYWELLALLGCADWMPQQVQRHLDSLERTFDAAAAVAETPFFFSSDITPAARPIAVDASRELIQSGFHREAVFWIVATFARCHMILGTDAPQLQRSLTPAFNALLADLGVHSRDDLVQRGKQVLLVPAPAVGDSGGYPVVQSRHCDDVP